MSTFIGEINSTYKGNKPATCGNPDKIAVECGVGNGGIKIVTAYCQTWFNVVEAQKLIEHLEDAILFRKGA